jgi:hypothetical protein
LSYRKEYLDILPNTKYLDKSELATWLIVPRLFPRPKAMFRRSSPSPSYSDALMHNHAASFSAPLPVTVPVPAQNPRGAAAGGYLDGNVGAFSSPPSSYYNYNNIQRSVSSHSLPMRLQPGDVSLGGRGFYSPSSPSAHQLTTTLPPLSSSPSSSSGELFEFTSPCPVRRVFSTGDLQVLRRVHRASQQFRAASDTPIHGNK